MVTFIFSYFLQRYKCLKLTNVEIDIQIYLWLFLVSLFLQNFLRPG